MLSTFFLSDSQPHMSGVILQTNCNSLLFSTSIPSDKNLRKPLLSKRTECISSHSLVSQGALGFEDSRVQERYFPLCWLLSGTAEDKMTAGSSRLHVHFFQSWCFHSSQDLLCGHRRLRSAILGKGKGIGSFQDFTVVKMCTRHVDLSKRSTEEPAHPTLPC